MGEQKPLPTALIKHETGDSMKLGISNDASELAREQPTEEPLLNHRARGMFRNARRASRVQR